MSPSPSPTAVYRARRDRFGAERDGLSRRWNLVANLRLLAFAAGASVLAWGLWSDRPVAIGAGTTLLAIFVALAVFHARLGGRRRRATTLTEINNEAAMRVAREWAGLPLRHSTRAAADHPYAADLDLFGRASLAQLLETPATPMGEAVLADWLLAPADTATVRDRQTAVAELAPALELRQELELRGRLAAADRADPEPFLAWAEGEPWLAPRPWLRWASWAGPLALAALAAAQVLGLTTRPYWAVPLIGNLLISQTVARPVYGILARVASRHRALLGDAAQLELLTETRFASAAMRRIQTDLGAGGQPAPALLRRLSRLAGLPIPPTAPIYLPIQALTMWDVHVLAAVERWQSTAGRRVRGWLATLGEAEALAALANLTHDNPAWVFPDLDPAADAFAARNLGHPLLRDDVRVVNDAVIGPPGTFLLVTGSNMSGKSTLLRAIGVNAVLAGAGGPVCAETCRMPPVALWTSVRVQDSLERGVSFFMAELQRLKLVVDAADRLSDSAAAAGGPRLLYLLDEILQGTNTAERQIAARRIIAHLVERGALGAVSTHDLALADAPELAAAARAVHLLDTVRDGDDGPTMTFDYRVRPGVATTTNALRLMRLVGLGLEQDGRHGAGNRDAATGTAATTNEQTGATRPELGTRATGS